MKLPKGLVPGTRWEVLSNERPAARDGRMRPRVRVKCACGEVRVLFTKDLQTIDERTGRPRASGCGNRRCFEVWEVTCAIRHYMTGTTLQPPEFETIVETLFSRIRITTEK